MNHRKFNTWCKRYVPVAHDVCLWLAHVVDQVGGRGDEEGGAEAEEQVASAGLLGRSVQDPILQVIPEVYDRVLEVTFTTLGDKTKLIISYRNRVMSGPVDQKRLSSRPPRTQQVSCKRRIWGPHCMQVMKHTSDGSTLALKHRADVARSVSLGPQKGIM